jgi:hypothetical protein
MSSSEAVYFSVLHSDQHPFRWLKDCSNQVDGKKEEFVT